MKNLVSRISYKLRGCTSFENAVPATGRFQTGFTLAEMLTVIAIFGVLSTIIIAQYREYDDSIILTNLAHDVALSIRQAQTYSVSVRSEEGDFDNGFGIHVDASQGSIYTLYHDGGNQYFNGGEELSIYQLGEGYTIRNCAIENNGDENCNVAYTAPLDIFFRRPNPEPRFYFGTTERTSNISGVRLYLESPQGNERTVTVFTTGQISVEE